MLDKDSIIKFPENCVNYSEQSIREKRAEENRTLSCLGCTTNSTQNMP